MDFLAEGFMDYAVQYDYNPEIVGQLMRRTMIDEDGHWLYKNVNSSGYGIVNFRPKARSVWEPTLVHRLSAHVYHGLDVFDARKLALHIVSCPYRNCWNPRCIYIGSHSDNVYDTVEAGTHFQSSKTHCPKGHEYTEKNTYIYYRGDIRNRHCKICKLEENRARRNTDEFRALRREKRRSGEWKS